MRVWLGPTGSGKSWKVVEEMRVTTAEKPLGAPIFWVVPDDVAFAAEQMLMEQVHSVLRPEVITMTRLAERVRSSAGVNQLQSINAVGKRLLFASVYQEVRDALGPLKRVQANSGFHEMVLAVFDEMTRFQVDLDALQGALEAAAASLEADLPTMRTNAGRSLIGKLHDLCLLYVRYREALDERAFFDPARCFHDAAQVVASIPWLSEAEIYIDGFMALEPQQFALCIALAQHVKRMTFVLPLSEPLVLQARDNKATYLSKQVVIEPLARLLPAISDSLAAHVPTAAYTYLQLVERLAEANLPFEVEVFSQTQRFKTKALAEIEANLKRAVGVVHRSVPASDDVAKSVRFWQASDEQGEAAAAAQAILQAVANGEIRYRDIAVLVPSLAEDGPRLQEAFTQWGIPHAIDAFPPLAAHPLGQLCLAAMRVIIDQFSADAIARLLRTEYCPLSERDADWLDIYIRRYNVSGESNWLTDTSWRFTADQADEVRMAYAVREDARAMELRDELRAVLEPFAQALAGAIVTPAKLAHALWDLLTGVGAKEKVAALVVSEDGERNPLLASQHEQAWQQVVALLNDLSSVYADASFLREELFEFVRDAFVGERQTSIPSGVDQVFISTYAHAHMWTKQHVFVLGLDERALPAKISPSGLLQDEEREMFHHLFGVPLGWTTTELMAAERAAAYMLFTRASQRLTVSFASMNGGAQRQPSPYYLHLRDMLGANSEMVDTGAIIGVEDEEKVSVIRASTAVEWMIQQLAQDKSPAVVSQLLGKPRMRAIAHWFTATEARQAVLKRALQGFYHHLPTGCIDTARAVALYGQPLRTSVHRLETYAACPYRYFLRYGLNVEPLQLNGMQASDVGNLLHDTVFALVDQERTGNVQFETLTRDEMVNLAKQVFETQLETPKHALFQQRPSRLAKALDLRLQLEAIAEVLWLHACHSKFRPKQLEWSFGIQGDDFHYSLSLEDGAEVQLRGRVDRLDTYQDGATTWFRIMDYKSGAKQRLDATRMFYGLQLQLILYTAVVQAYLGKDGAPQPAGAFYMPLLAKLPIAQTPLAKDAALTTLRRALRAEGYMHLDGDAIEAMDDTLQAGKSDLFAEVYKQDQTLRKQAKVWTQAQWEQVITLTLTRIREIASRLLAGEIPVRPYLYSHQDTACRTCPFQGVCHFESTDHRAVYRWLQPKRMDEIVSETKEGSS
ncbi:PD-(D/E)XK nuclease family protein [Alicyclobacillus fodiniaquatilis]|uniref:PD-(D/E)XK nuclease family protein n=1 Tax=Alicyclobacillus fodiniaquatilis TaxID=1661150 RepID=A0ABW4JNL9_9BACL